MSQADLLRKRIAQIRSGNVHPLAGEQLAEAYEHDTRCADTDGITVMMMPMVLSEEPVHQLADLKHAIGDDGVAEMDLDEAVLVPQEVVEEGPRSTVDAPVTVSPKPGLLSRKRIAVIAVGIIAGSGLAYSMMDDWRADAKTSTPVVELSLPLPPAQPPSVPLSDVASVPAQPVSIVNEGEGKLKADTQSPELSEKVTKPHRVAPQVQAAIPIARKKALLVRKSSTSKRIGKIAPPSADTGRENETVPGVVALEQNNNLEKTAGDLLEQLKRARSL